MAGIERNEVQASMVTTPSRFLVLLRFAKTTCRETEVGNPSREVQSNTGLEKYKVVMGHKCAVLTPIPTLCWNARRH